MTVVEPHHRTESPPQLLEELLLFWEVAGKDPFRYFDAKFQSGEGFPVIDDQLKSGTFMDHGKDHFGDLGWEDVHPFDDQHVVRAPEGLSMRTMVRPQGQAA